MTAATETRAKTIVPPFGLECDPGRNTDVMLQGITGCRLRGSINASKTVKDYKTGDDRIPKDQVMNLSMLPSIPGHEIHVNPAKLTYTIIDPLFEDEELCAKIVQGMKSDDRPFPVEKITGRPPQSGELDKHWMKTLCRELIRMIESGDMKLVKGTEPKLEDVDELPGNYLLNPGSQYRTSQPRYEKDLEAWVDRLSMSGGV